MKFITALLLLFVVSTSHAYEAEPTKQDFKDYYSVMKLLYSDMPPVMNGMETLIEADFKLERVKDKQVICDFIQSIERMEYIASNAKLHPQFRNSLKEFDKIKKEDMTAIKKEIQNIGHRCI